MLTTCSMKSFISCKPCVGVLVLIVLFLMAIFYLYTDVTGTSPMTMFNNREAVRTLLACNNSRFGQSLLSAQKHLTDKVHINIYFDEKPSFDVQEFLAENGIILMMTSWTSDYLEAETTVERLCFLADLPGITNITLNE